jgi:hypothetical protein
LPLKGVSEGNLFDKVRDTLTDDGRLWRQGASYLIIYKDNDVIHAGYCTKGRYVKIWIRIR